jgi:hypothetical protein
MHRTRMCRRAQCIAALRTTFCLLATLFERVASRNRRTPRPFRRLAGRIGFRQVLNAAGEGVFPSGGPQLRHQGGQFVSCRSHFSSPNVLFCMATMSFPPLFDISARALSSCQWGMATFAETPRRLSDRDDASSPIDVARAGLTRSFSSKNGTSLLKRPT